METLSNCSCAAFTYEFKFIEFKNGKELVDSLNQFFPGTHDFFEKRSIVDVQVIKLDYDYNFCIVKLVYFDPVIHEI